jgi:hypothetical protein
MSQVFCAHYWKSELPCECKNRQKNASPNRKIFPRRCSDKKLLCVYQKNAQKNLSPKGQFMFLVGTI